MLTQAGLAAALRTLADSAPVPVELALGDVEGRRFDPAVESSAWFVACESVANAVRHGAPSRLEVSAHREPDALKITVRDDGCGGADSSVGRGLAGLADRVHALGGDLEIRSPPGAGTVVTARLPVA